MYTKWSSHIQDPDEKTSFENSVISAKPVLERLLQLIQEEKQGLELAECSPKIYDTPNWDYRQAHGNGFKGALNFVTKLINLDQQKQEYK